MKILILPRYENLAASSRFRFYQYIPKLKEIGWDITVKPLLSNNYVKYLYFNKSLKFGEIFKSYLNRINNLLRNNRFDIVWLQQEALPWIPYFIETLLLKSSKKLVTDYDDAFFHRYDLHKNKIVRTILKNKIDSVMAVSDLILAGNDYLASRAALNNSFKRITIFPTVVDTAKYTIRKNVRKNKEFTIGWIGSPGTEKYLNVVSGVLNEIVKFGKIKISLIGAKNFKNDDGNINFIKWNEKTEVEEISKFDVGIMPLLDNPWERGKCGFKLIQYFACGIPVIGSPIGINNKIISHGQNGFLAKDITQWRQSLIYFINNRERAKEMGLKGRKLVEKKYSLKNNILDIKNLFNDLVSE